MKLVIKCFIFLLFLNILFINQLSGGNIRSVQDKTSFILSKSAPNYWGEKPPGIKTKFITKKKQIALTFDACGRNKLSSGYDEKLINFLIENKISATLFITNLWIESNLETFKKLAGNSLFEIANHGLNHKPASVNGNFAYGIKGTSDINELIKEVDDNKKIIYKVTKKMPLFYRSGTNYYDEVAIQVIYQLNQIPVGYSVLGDAGASFNTEQVKNAILSAKPGDIILMHMNHPEGDTAEGVIEAIPILIKEGYQFVKLSEVEKLISG